MSEDARARALREWLSALYPEADIRMVPASVDASFRRYFRIEGVADVPRVAMDAPPGQEDLGPFLNVGARLMAAGIRVPAVLAQDRRQGFLLLEDLGRETYLQAFAHSDPAPLMAAAIPALVRMQSHTASDGLPVYDQDLLMRELRLFPDWYLAEVLGLRLCETEQQRFAESFEALCRRALAQARVFVHRDFMPRNLMASPPLPGVIDFQDAVQGPISYDPVCLFMDAFYSFEPGKVTEGLLAYYRQAWAQGLPLPESEDAFLSDCCWMAAHRHIKVIGIFARIARRDGKPHYLKDVPRFFQYLRASAADERARGNTELAECLAPLLHFAPGEARGAAV
ncbi:aminoglycoside/choline kinase family phosphotransferase [Natronospira proteinivora]|uniref:Aminoglycoside/choline kinase family phosphotransferase n=1 Tax=Natronospira proteinivora TaxID=1807133 RepID=A0ABT1GAV6_9GAMM|nr:phosphotransferase [Natronospira proteinivora]MCP1727388.1 aminoglycoside/choline kinase family phosphotransferase [Natronospira proteinivora]